MSQWKPYTLPNNSSGPGESIAVIPKAPRPPKRSQSEIKSLPGTQPMQKVSQGSSQPTKRARKHSVQPAQPLQITPLIEDPQSLPPGELIDDWDPIYVQEVYPEVHLPNELDAEEIGGVFS